MPPVRTLYVACFSSQLNSSQRDKPHPEEQTTDRTEPPSQVQGGESGNKRGNMRGEKTRCVLKVKLPKFNKKATKVDKTPRGWTLEPAAPRHLTPETGGGGGGGVQSGGTDSESVGRDAFSFSQRSTSTTISQKEKAKLAVLRTITKVLEENQLIRQRLVGLSQAN